MSTPDPPAPPRAPTASAGPTCATATDPPPEEPAYVLWSPTRQESVFSYPPGSVEEHLVTEHGIDSLVVRCRPQAPTTMRVITSSRRACTGAVGDLPAVGHAHEQAA
jgi:hypothetical protein